ncbi:MAG: tetratricopeptide repeat protein [Elusimicrobia bacterium]|nr:tetratricopeptide repeat protein [Elusimicrobiota bacterium]
MKSGDYYLKKKIYPKAIAYYERYLKNSNSAPLAPWAFLGIARSWVGLGQCDKAAEFYEKAAREDPWGPLSAQSQQGIADCGNFYPLAPGAEWTEGDSLTRGRNMKALNQIQKEPHAWLVRRKIYATGRTESLFEEQLIVITKKPGLLWERSIGSPDPEPGTLILEYPFKQGHSWTTQRSGRKIRRSVVQTNLRLTMPVGSFEGCIEIAEELLGNGSEESLPSGSRIYDTYCPGTGRVRTMMGHLDKRTPHTELLQTPE